MAQKGSNAIGSFAGGVGQNIVANVCGGAMGAACVTLGLASSADLTSLDSWPSWLVVGGGLVALAFGGNLLRLAFRWRRRRRIGKAGGQLIARLEGEDQDHAPKQRAISAAIRQGLGDAVAITLWPDELRLPDGRDIDAYTAVQRKAQRWLKQSGCDLLIWGHVKADHAVELAFASPVAAGAGRSYGLSSDRFELTADFGEELAMALAARVAVEAAPAFESGSFQETLLRRARARIEPLLDRPLPDAARGEVLFYHAALLARLGEVTPEPDDLLAAVTAYRAAQEVYTREALPLQWAMT